jgi:CelD/BcsL family acetyltransferase involved in cellulose biosynthesis
MPVDQLEWFVVEDEAGFRALTPEWARLAATLPQPSHFASPAWTGTWWAHFGAGRRPRLVGARRGGALVALAPLCTRRVGGVRVREFLGSEESDLSSLLLAPGEAALGPTLARAALEGRDWDLASLWCVADGSPTAEAFRGVLAATGARHEVAAMTVNPILDVRGDAWDAGASRSMLKDLARQRRVLGRQAKLEVRFPADVAEIDAALADLRAFHAVRWANQGEVSRLQLPDYWAWMGAITRTAHAEGWLYFPRLVLGERLIATGLYFLYGRRLFYWMGAHDPEFARHSPNGLLTLEVIERLRVTGLADVLDFGRGDESYKLRWTGDSYPLLQVTAYRGVRGRAAFVWQNRVRPWAWAHQSVSRPIRRAKRVVRRLLTRTR